MMAPPVAGGVRSSAPLVLSTLACVLSGSALLVALGNAPAGGAAAMSSERPAAAYGENQVTISGLTISRGQLADGAVDEPALASSSATTRVLADGAVTATKMSIDAIREIARAVTTSVNIVGEVDEAGNVLRGEGFIAKRVSTGVYLLSFNQPFLEQPVVVAVAQSYGVCYLPSDGIGPASVRIKVRSPRPRHVSSSRA